MLPNQPPITTAPALRLGGVIVISMALHWLLLATGTERPVEPAARPLVVELLPPTPSPKPIPATPLAMRAPAPQAQPQPAATHTVAAAVPVATPATAAITAPAAISQAKTVATPVPTQNLATHPIEQGGTQPSSAAKPMPSDHWQDQIRNSINADISRHFKYPRQARQRNWEGTVLLELLIEIDGRISRITLAQSSGYALLDNNAIATLTRIGNVSGAQQWLGGQNLELQLPVIYRLSDS